MSSYLSSMMGGPPSRRDIVVPSTPMDLTDRMYTDLIQSLVWSRDCAERRALEAEKRLHELNVIIGNMLPSPPTTDPMLKTTCANVNL